MDEYIKRKDAFEILQSRLDNISQMSYLDMDWHELDIMRNAIENAIDDIGEVPAVDVQSVKYGRWSECYMDSIHYSGICTACKSASVRQLMEKPYEFCPRCGAKMIKDGDVE